MSIPNINANFTHRVAPNYAEEVVTFNFKEERDYEKWYEEVACQHGVWLAKDRKEYKKNFEFIGKTLAIPLPVKSIYYVCDHSGQKKKLKTEDAGEEPKAKRIRKKDSIKVGCPAKFTKYYLTDDSLVVKYKWNHEGHNPYAFCNNPMDQSLHQHLSYHSIICLFVCNFLLF